MPTASEASFEEARRWIEVADRWGPTVLWEDRPPTEKAVVVFFDPSEDLAKRAEKWSHELTDSALRSLARFAAALADAEGRHWESGDADLATRVYEARRFLVGDRIIHWAVPWLDAVVRCYPEFSDAAGADRDFLLDVGDEMRVEPLIPDREGMVVKGEDSLGRVAMVGGMERWVSSVWSGRVSMGVEVQLAPDEMAGLYMQSARHWTDLAATNPGSAQIWTDLAERASRTGEMLAG